MDITPGWAGVAVSACVALGGSVAAWLRSVDSSQEARISDVKGVQKMLFEKHDLVVAALQNYRIYAAETYINRDALREQLGPINRALENIQQELREGRARGG